MTREETPDSARPADPGGAARALWRWCVSLFVLPPEERKPLPFERSAFGLRLQTRFATWRRQEPIPARSYERPGQALTRWLRPHAAKLNALLGTHLDHVSGSVDAGFERAPVAAAVISTVALGLLGLYAATGLSTEAQVGLGSALFVLALILRDAPTESAGLLLIGLSLLATSRYIVWRVTQTLGVPLSIEWWMALGLLAAEAYTWVVLLLGYLQNARPLRRPVVDLPLERREWPTVDVFIPTYNESLSVVRPTVFAALSLDWPAEHLTVWLLDDGDREEFRDFAAVVGARYLTRSDRRGAKAGNLNHALRHSDGKFIAIFDCDHVPVRTFLTETIGTLTSDDRCALVQTPHHFFSPDPFERNLGTYRKVPGEGSLFYGLVQDGNDLWNAAYFCGSCAVLRRDALERIGGLAEDTVTEDAHTALRLHREGYRSAYVNRILAAGLATESLADHVNQRARWARGMAQIFRLDNPLFGPGLTLAQRLCYLNAMLHFFSGLPRLVFLTAPLAYLYFEFHVLNATTVLLAAYAVPHLMQAALANSALQRQYRHSLWNEAYEAALSWYTSLPTLIALINPRRGRFNVTAKGGLIEESYFDWRLALPYLALVLLNLAGVLIAVPRFLYWNTFESETVVINLIWTLFNLTLLGTVLGVASETRQVRRAHRIEAALPARLHCADGSNHAATVLDFSSGGLRLKSDIIDPSLKGQLIGVEIDMPTPRGSAKVFGRCVVCLDGEARVQLEAMDPSTERRYVEATFAHPGLWKDWHDRMPPDRPLRSLAEVLSFGLAGYVRMSLLLRDHLAGRLRAGAAAIGVR